MKMTNYLLGYKNMYIVQDPTMFKFSLDSVLLPNFVTINKGTKYILDIGTGNAPIPLVLSTKTNAHITGVEIQKEVSEMAIESVKINHKENQIDIINDDINELYKTLETEKYDIITCNPPYFKVKSDSIVNNNDYKTIARHEVKLSLEQILKISKKLLKNNGVIAMVHRPDRLVEILTLMHQNNIEPKKIQFIYPKYGEEANMLLIEGSKNGNLGLKILSPLYVYDGEGNYTDEISNYFVENISREI